MPQHLWHHDNLPGVPVIAQALIAVALAGVGRGYAVERGLPPATVACFGDSIYAGAGGEQVCFLLGQLLPDGYVETNKAVSSETANQIAHRVIAEASTACVGEPCGTYWLNGALNTLKHVAHAALADAAVAQFALHGDGESVLGIMDGADWLHEEYPRAVIGVAGVTPYGGCNLATCPSLIRPGPRAEAYDAALRAACALRPWLLCSFPYRQLEDPQNPSRLRHAIAHPDGIHLLIGGHAELAAMLYALRMWP